MTKPDSLDKILFCSSFTPPVNAGGGRNSYNFGKFLVKMGHEVTLVSLNRKGQLKGRELDEGLKIHRILYFNQNLFTKLISLLIILPNYLIRIIKNKIVFIFGANIVGYQFIIIFCWLLRKKVIYQSTLIGDDDLASLSKKHGKFITNFFFNRITWFHSLNPEFTRAWVESSFSLNKVIEITQGVNNMVFSKPLLNEKFELRDKLNLPKDQIVIISVGFVIKRKGFEEIFSVLSNISSKFHYVIVGDYKVDSNHYMSNFSKEMETLFTMGKDLLKSKITFAGPKNQIEEYLKASDIFLLNSEQEGVPNALLEAMSCGLACCFVKMKGIENFLTIDGENAIIFKDGQELYKKIDLLINDIKLTNKLGDNANKYIAENFSFDKVYNKMTEEIPVFKE